MLYWTVWDMFIQVLYLGRAPRTKETLPDFSEKCRVTRHSRVFCQLTSSQRPLCFRASHPPSLLRCLGGRTGTLFRKGRHSRRLPLSTFLDASRAGPESSLAKEGFPSWVLITSSRATVLVSKVLVGDELPGAKFRRSTIT